MKLILKLGFLALWLCVGYVSIAQTVTLYPTVVIAPRGTTQTVTAIVNGTNNKTVTWSTNHGTIVGTNPCVVNEPCTIGVHDTTAETATLTATTNVGAVVATSSITFTASPTPATTHPRLMVTSGMLAGLQGKATSGNTIYQAIKNYTTTYMYNVDNAAPISWGWTTWSGSACTGGTGLPANDQSGYGREADAYNMAYLSMIAPTSGERNAWGCHGRDIWTYVMNQVILGNEVIIGNHWSDSAQQFMLTTDWLMAGGYLSSADQTQARSYLAFMAKTIFNYGYGITPPVDPYNAPGEFSTGAVTDLGGMRLMGNNYTLSKMLYMVGASLTFNDTTGDDPPLANTCAATRYVVCPDGTAGSLHAYWTYFAGAMLYMDWAHLEDPNVSQQAYNAAFSNMATQPTCLYISGVSYPCLGDGRGGESSEGSWYQYSLYRLRYAMNMIHTAGYDDPIIYGPQISLGTSSWWDLKYVSDLSFITGFAPNNGPSTRSPAYSYLSTGDSNTYYRQPADMFTEAAMMTADSYTGRTDRSNALEWIILNMAYGGPLGTSGGCTTYCGFDSEMMNVAAQPLTPDLFIALPAGDPVASLPSDPRPALPTDLYNGSYNQHTMVRSGWTSPTIFSEYCPNTLIDHELQWCGRFDVFANGEYITKGRVVFNDYNTVMSSAPQSNIMSVFNSTGSGATAPWVAASTAGGQWWHGEQFGLNTMLHSELPSYTAEIADTTNSYNGWWAYASPYDIPSYNDVTAASRSLVYLRGTNQVAYYDRAAVGHAASVQATWLNTTGSPTVSGNVAHWLTRSTTQKAYYTTLLPSGATLANNTLTAGGSGQGSDWEPYSTLSVTPSGTPTSSQFLSVLEFGSSTLTQSPTTLVQSSSGQNFDGSLIGLSVVMFMRTPTTFTGVTYPASGGTTHYVADLAPNTSYAVSGAGTPGGSVLADTAGVLTFEATGTGNIVIGAGTPVASTPTFSPTAGAVSNPTTVTASSTTSGSGCTIYFDTSATPTTAQTTYSVTTGVTLYAQMRGCAGYSDSAVASAAYTITVPPAGPQVKLSGSITVSGSVVIQ